MRDPACEKWKGLSGIRQRFAVAVCDSFEPNGGDRLQISFYTPLDTQCMFRVTLSVQQVLPPQYKSM
jgi:hypothetical protein